MYNVGMIKESDNHSLMKELQPCPLEDLFEHLSDVYFFAKNREGCFIMANQLFVEQCGQIEKSAVIGKTDYDFFPKDRADLYVHDDNWVMTTGRSMVNRVELAPDRNLSLNLFVTTKIPLRNKEGEINGLAGIARDLNLSKQNVKPFTQMEKVIDHIHSRFQERIRIPDLASLAGMSLSQFERKFKDLFQLTPQEYIIEIRLNRACKQIAMTVHTFSEIAQDCGFYDHSHFTRKFVEHFDITPSEYRQRHYR